MKTKYTYTEAEVQKIIKETVDKTSTFFHDNLKNQLSIDIF